MVTTPVAQIHIAYLERRQLTRPKTEQRGQPHVVAVPPAHLVTGDGQAVDLLDHQSWRHAFDASTGAFDG